MYKIESDCVPGRPGTSRDGTEQPVKNPIPSRGKISILSLCPGTMKELLSLCPEKLHCPVPLETLVKSTHFFAV
jgi:hypothetical protein